MTATPRELLETSIGQLQALSAFLGDQLAVVTARSEAAAEVRACEEILVSLGALILKVQAAGGVSPSRRATLPSVTASLPLHAAAILPLRHRR